MRSGRSLAHGVARLGAALPRRADDAGRPPARKADQEAPEPRTPTGAPSADAARASAQQGDRLTTAQGLRLGDTDHSLKAGPRGPVLLQDHHLREKITHFDHERIPERVVHARGAAAHGEFVANGAAESVTRAAFLKKGVRTRVFTRFSTVLGSRGSADTVRDTRGFATKFYTQEGVYDLVGNNIPVFFIQDAITFPDVVHAGKPHPDREIPQAQSAHDTFWDFVSLHTEAQAHTMMFEGIDLLDPTKFVPEELAPLQIVGTMTLTANPTNYFAETEQVAFHPGHLVPGIDVTSDPLLQGRLFSYLDTQISRLGGPNFAQLPVNRPHAPVNDMLRDGMHQSAVHTGVAPSHPNTLDGGCPFHAGADEGAFVDLPVTVTESAIERAQPRSFDDHFSQARLFYRSLTEVEQEHVRDAYAFELAKCYEQAITERQLRALARIDADLCAFVADALGLAAPEATEPLEDVEPSPALRMIGETWPIDGRVVAILTGDEVDAAELSAVRHAVDTAGALPLVLAPHGGLLGEIPVQRTPFTAASIEFDALVALAPSEDARVVRLVDEISRQGKAIGAVEDAGGLLASAGVATDAPGVVVGTATEVTAGVLEALAAHRAWERVAG